MPKRQMLPLCPRYCHLGLGPTKLPEQKQHFGDDNEFLRKQVCCELDKIDHLDWTQRPSGGRYVEYIDRANLCLITVIREKFTKNKKNTSKERFSFLLFKCCYFTLSLFCRFVTNFFETLLKKFYTFENEENRTCWHHLSRQFCSGAEHLKQKKLFCLTDIGTYLHVFCARVYFASLHKSYHLRAE